jgi:putative tryptophan/tyrosine transport system substrate-binding protein
MAIHIQRREFIGTLGRAAAWPLAARAQQPKVRRIGVLMNTVSDDAEGQARLAAFHQGLQQLGWTVGHNVQIDYRWGGDDAERTRRGAAELIALGSDAILASGTPSVAALQQATDRIPIVFAQVIDPVGSGFVASLARPGGCSSSASLQSGWSYSKRSRLASRGWRCFGTLLSGSASWRQSRRSRRRWAWS